MEPFQAFLADCDASDLLMQGAMLVVLVVMKIAQTNPVIEEPARPSVSSSDDVRRLKGLKLLQTKFAFVPGEFFNFLRP